MPNEHPPPNDRGELSDRTLDAALRAAAGDAHIGSVVTVLRDSLGDCPRVLLRDEPEDAALVRPLTPDARPPIQRYQIAGEIARGGVGVVLKGRDVDLGRDVAMKTLRPEYARSTGMIRRFVEEAQITGQLQHPGILPIYELGLQADRVPFFTMKLVRGKTLSALLSARREPVEDRARYLTIFEQVCQTVAYAHSRGVIHRDLKPSNVMVGHFGEVQIVDWGLAKVLPQGGVADERAAARPAPETIIETVRTAGGHESVAGSVMGTPAYMPPEQARGEVERLDERSDVWSLGAILCEVLTGDPPLVGDHEDLLARARRDDFAEAFARLDQCGADAELIALARRCLAPQPAQRPRDAGAVTRDVAEYHASLESRARALEVAAAEAAARAHEERRARRLTVALASAIILAIALLAVGYFAVRQDQLSRINQQTAAVNSALDDAQRRLGRAAAAPVGVQPPWTEVRAAADSLQRLLDASQISDEGRARAAAFLTELERADADRQLVESMEQIVVLGATHQDRDSWLQMERRLRESFLAYGIDLRGMSHDEVARRIRESRLADKLADMLELWIGSAAHLMGNFGVVLYPEAELLAWLNVVYAADPDEFRTSLRKLLYSPAPTREEAHALLASADLESLHPRTIAWLGSLLLRAGDQETMYDVFRRGVRRYPDDFMLNFDCAYHLVNAGEPEEALWYYMRCLAIRPTSSGIWRCAAIAMRDTGRVAESIDALRESIRHEPDHPWTHLDLGISHEAAGDSEAALAAYRDALALRADFPPALARCGRLLVSLDRPREALPLLEKCADLVKADPTWNLPADESLAECRAAISGP